MAIPKLDTLGRILSGLYTDWYILVEDADLDEVTQYERNYYVFTVKYNVPRSELLDHPDYLSGCDLGYDSCYVSWEELELNLKNAEIEWLEGEEIFFGHRYYFKHNPRL